MQKGKYASKGKYARSTGYKPMALLLAMVLLLGCAIGGTLAWLVDKTDPVTNTFTTSDIDITLAETKTDFQMRPAWTIDKDPKVTVQKDSEDCWLFVEVKESCGVSITDKGTTTNYQFSDFIVYNIDTTGTDKWTAGKGDKSEANPDGDGIPTNVYYRKVEGVTSDKVFEILAAGSYEDPKAGNFKVTWSANQVATKPSVTKEMMEAVDKATDKPTLTFTAYASQLWKTNKPTDESEYSEAQFTPAQAWANVNPST